MTTKTMRPFTPADAVNRFGRSPEWRAAVGAYEDAVARADANRRAAMRDAKRVAQAAWSAEFAVAQSALDAMRDVADRTPEPTELEAECNAANDGPRGLEPLEWDGAPCPLHADAA